MPETSSNRTPRAPFIILSEVDSSNNYAMAKLQSGDILPGTCFLAIHQTAGKGQRGRQWAANKSENITMSLCLRPFHREYPFLFSASIALGCYDFIKESGVAEPSVKWPNDLYINDRKAAGILIENTYLGSHWDWSVAGIGMNLNQLDFGPLSDKATSLKTATGRSFELVAAGKDLRRCVWNRVEQMQQLDARAILEDYNSVLYKRGQKVKVRQGTAVFTTTFSHAEESGELVARDTIERRFTVGDIELV